VRGTRGQATIETVAMLPLLVLVALALGQVLAARAAATLAAGAAEAGAAALLQDRDAADAARSALGDTPHAQATIRITGRRIHVRVRPRVVLPALAEALAATATADAGPASVR
jgi:TRAP-type mannitol/chloroaromatic compound transport system permease large subunit